MTRVAVYGTLKRGHANHEQHLAGETPEHALFVSIPFRMYTGDRYPMLVPTAVGRNPVWVEIYPVDDAKLRELDSLEIPYGYLRRSVFVDELGGDVELYYHPGPAPASFTPVPSGMWPDRG